MAQRNSQALYGRASWWADEPRWLTSLKNVVPARLRYAREAGFGFDGLDTLDLGCGGGFMAEALSGAGARVVGVDPDADVLAQARAHAAASGLAIDYRRGDAYAVPLPDASVDRVVCVDVLEHLEDVGAAVAEIGRVLRPGGVFLFDTLNRTPFARVVNVHLAEDLLGLLPRGIHDPALFVRPEELRACCRAAGLDVEGIRGLGPVGIDLRGVLRFGLIPITWGMYIGHAVKLP